MADKTDDEIINEEKGLMSNDINEEEALSRLSLDDNDELSNGNEDDKLTPTNENSGNTNNSNNEDLANNSQTIENEDKDDESGLEKNKTAEEKEKEFTIQKRQPKIYKILMGIAGGLFLILIVGIILYASGFFDPEEKKPVEVKKVEVKKAQPEVVFDEKEIDKQELNKKLTMLTKKEIMNKDELEAEEQRIEEEKRKEEEAQKKALEEKKKEEEMKLAAQLEKIQAEKKALEEQQEAIKKQQEEFLKLQEEAKKELEQQKEALLQNLNNPAPSNSIVDETQGKEEITEQQAQDIIDNNTQQPVTEIVENVANDEMGKSFLTFINVATIKGVLYKSFLDEIQKYEKKISLCRDSKNRIEIYFGPYSSDIEREKVFNLLLENDHKEAYLVDFTKEEYQKRCEY